MLKVKLDANLRLGRDAMYVVPPELLALLASIQRHGSLVTAIREADVSYRHAWGLLRRWEAITGHKLVVQTRGQGTDLTPFGKRLAEVRDWLAPRIEQSINGLDRALADHLNVASDFTRTRIEIHASHDIALLKLKERLDGQFAIDLHFEGSLNSLDSLARGDCDVAGFHVPDPPTLLGALLEEFRPRLNRREHYVARLLSRHQGLMIAKEASRRVRGLKDLARLGLRFVNRERGSGTRLLFDAMLARDGLAAAAIKGYEHEEFTHMATAATVRAGMADAAFGIEAAARAHGLGFVHLVTEHYYVACRRSSSARVAVDTMVAVARSSAFARAVARIGGYETKSSRAEIHLSDLFGPPARS
ncbi:MAG TPA: substrate-binding domain-containing protein [Casimicrobiaceae bacterium]|nr:substrate-binding domain-containing protein [Casimicrobiaceae bacterium]